MDSASPVFSENTVRSLKGAVIAAVLLAFIAVVAVFYFAPRKTVEHFGSVPDFQFEAIPNRKLSKSDLLGKVWVAGFVFTSCQGICPAMSAKMKTLQQAFAQTADFRLVSFSIDPKRDSQSALAAFQAKWTDSPETWFYARPDRAQLESFAAGLKLVVGEVGDFAHTTRLVLVDKRGNIRGYYHGTDDEQLQRLQSDAGSILLE